MACLRNSQADMEIGVTTFGAFKQPALFIRQGNHERCLGTFFSEQQAQMFMEVLKQWDEAGGSDQ